MSEQEIQKPSTVADAFNKALSIFRTGRNYAAAEQICRSILRRNPGNVATIGLLSAIARKTGRLKEALMLSDQAIRLAPNRSSLHNDRGLLLATLKRPRDAIAAYDRAIRLDPGNHAAFLNRGNVLLQQGKLREGLADIEHSLELRTTPQALSRRGIALHLLGDSDAALASLDQSLALSEAPSGLNNKGNLLFNLNQFEPALSYFDRAIALDPGCAEAHYNKGLVELLLGRWNTGFREYDWRALVDGAGAPNPFPKPVWDGTRPIAGKTLYLYSELFLGDTIQFCRYARLVQAAGAKVILSAQSSLHALLRTLSPEIELKAAGEAPAGFDHHCPLLSLPRAFGTTVDDAPADVPYLKPDPHKVALWKKRIGEHGFKIGVCWQGSTRPYAIAMQRSFPLSALHEISQVDGVRLISLQKHDGLDQLDGLPPGMTVEQLGDDFDAGADAFIDTAAVMQSLDLIITADTATAHVAGALARPTWIALPARPDWRWLLDRTDTPWYPTARLFRQKSKGVWDVFSEMAACLPARMREKPKARKN